jgi:23S rRNA (uracil1939-C5)-methyltransferase
VSDILTITRLGRLGDGVAETAEGPRHIARALPGERVREDGGRVEIVEASARRVTPPCRHFGDCGGCQMQHLERSAYLEWKTGLLAEALQRQSIEAQLQPILSFSPASRRRAVFSALRLPGGVVLGFSREASNRIVGLTQCHVLEPAIAGALPALRRLCAAVLARRGTAKVSVLATPNGLDVAVEQDQPIGEKARREAAAISQQEDFARLSVNGETLLELRRPAIRAGKAWIVPPPGAFLQAVDAAEEAMARLGCGHLAGEKRVADLFCGVGAFALRLAGESMVLASDSDGPALAALERAWRETGGGLKEVRTLRRDLLRSPVTAGEMKGLGGVLFDPPRAGAEAQAREIALSKVAKVAAISCNPVTLARDLAILLEGGLRIKSITPVDQFHWTPHLEAVALLER